MIKKRPAALLAGALLVSATGVRAWAAGVKGVQTAQPLPSQLPPLTALHCEPLRTQPLLARLMALQVQPIAALERLKASEEPAEAALHQLLSHPEVLTEQRDALAPVIGAENFQKLLAAAADLNRLAGQNSAVRQALSSGADPAAALRQFKSHFDGAGEPVAGFEGSTAAAPELQAIAGSPFQSIHRDGRKFLELKTGDVVRTMEMGSGGARAPRVKFLRPDVLEVAVGDKPFLVKLTEDNLRSLATMMEYLSDPDASLTNLMLRGDMGTGKNTLVYTLAGLLNPELLT